MKKPMKKIRSVLITGFVFVFVLFFMWCCFSEETPQPHADESQSEESDQSDPGTTKTEPDQQPDQQPNQQPENELEKEPEDDQKEEQTEEKNDEGNKTVEIADFSKMEWSLLTSREISMYKGESATVSVSAKRTGGFTETDMTAVSSDPSVATIKFSKKNLAGNYEYTITPVSIGETSVYVKSNHGETKTAEIKVTVKASEITKFHPISTKDFELRVGEKKEISFVLETAGTDFQTSDIKCFYSSAHCTAEITKVENYSQSSSAKKKVYCTITAITPGVYELHFANFDGSLVSDRINVKAISDEVVAFRFEESTNLNWESFVGDLSYSHLSVEYTGNIDNSYVSAVSTNTNVATVTITNLIGGSLFYKINVIGYGEAQVYFQSADGSVKSPAINITVPQPAPTPQEPPEDVPSSDPVTPDVPTTPTEQPDEKTYYFVLNTNTMKAHYESCRHVATISDHNYATTEKSPEELKSQGYTACKTCDPWLD